jgi:hypothetical protein
MYYIPKAICTVYLFELYTYMGFIHMYCIPICAVCLYVLYTYMCCIPICTVNLYALYTNMYCWPICAVYLYVLYSYMYCISTCAVFLFLLFSYMYAYVHILHHSHFTGYKGTEPNYSGNMKYLHKNKIVIKLHTFGHWHAWLWHAGLYVPNLRE